MLWSRNATAKVATSMTAGDCARSGRKTTRSITTDKRDHDAEAERDPDHERQVPLGREGERVGAGHHELPVREVDEPEHAEDEPDADRHQRVHGPEADRVDDHLPADAEEPERHERYAATILSVSPASAGVSVSRSSPFAITYVRSASATVR